MTKKLLLIAAIAVMLVGATSAYGYYESWNGWFNSGYLRYGGNDFTSVGGWDVVSDSTIDEELDDFYLKVNVCVHFVYGSDTIMLGIDGFTGSKETDTTGTKEGSGDWLGSAILTIPGLPPVVFDTVEGTWRSTYPHFNYDTRPPTYTASWLVTRSVPAGITGAGGSAGERWE